jgi:hypothetical protein
MILKSGHSTKYLNDYKDGNIQMGLGVNCDLDDYIRFKRKQLNIVLGHDNVGKSYFMEWYFLALSSIHDIKHTIWMGENSSGQVMRDLIQMYTGRNFKDLNYKEIRRAEMKMEYWFTFIDNSKLYTPNEMLDIFGTTDSDNYFIDPFTGLDRGMSHADNYEFLNKTRQFCNQTDKTIYISTHPNSESGRTSMIYPAGHEWVGHLKPPLKAHIEGGKPFLNRCDDMLTIHRLTKHPQMFMFTMVDIEKVKDRDTGGKQTELNRPIMCDYNFGLGFKINGIDPIKRPSMIPIQQQIEMQEIKEKETSVKVAQAFANVNLTPEKSTFETEYEKNKPDDVPF